MADSVLNELERRLALQRKGAQVFNAIERGAQRWKGSRGSAKDPSLVLDLNERQRAFVLTAQRQEQHAQEQRLMHQLGAAYVRRLLQAKERAIALPRPLRRGFGICITVRLIHHQSTRQADTYYQRMAVMEDSIKLEALEGWARTCLGLRERQQQQTQQTDASGLSFLYFSPSGRPTKLSSKTALQHWLDGSWATHPPTLHVLDTTRLLQRALEPLNRIRAVFEEYDTDGDGSISLEEMQSMVSELQLPELGLSQHQVLY